jgi:hypothetical protein
MSNASLKEKIKERVDQLENKSLLEEILQWIEMESISDEVFIIP